MKSFKKTDIITLADSKITSGVRSNALVAFVDLLGFSSELVKNWENNAEDFLHRIMRIKSYVDLCKDVGIYHEFRDYDEVTPIDKSEYPKHITFSDSFIFIKELDTTSSQTRITSVLSLFSSIQELWRYAIEEGFTIRGAADYGPFFYNDHDIIGPAFISTYKMESNLAQISRVLCSDSIARIIKQHIPNSHHRLQDYCQLWFKKDIDDVLILNPCIAFGLNNGNGLAEAKQRVEKMRLGADNHDARSKYIDLIERLGEQSIHYSDMQIFNR